MMKLLAQLKHRQMFRIAAAYAVVAWLLLQLFNNLAPILELPAYFGRAFVLLLAIGFPVAMFFAWMRELPPADAATEVKTNKLDLVLAGGLAVVIAIFAFQQLVPSGVTIAQPQAGVEAAKEAAASSKTGISLAVLPFSNLSGDASQEFFSDGMTEEITSALARIPDLRVVGRTSAFQFKGERKDLRAIGQALNATHLIEGSVRKAGDRVRITVQLIRADDGTNMLSENYDRELIDVFAIQEEIGRAIATSFNMRLGLAPGQNLVSNRTENSGIYQDFLQGKAWLRARGTPNSGPYLKTLESVVARDPSFAPAWALLARAYSLEPGRTDIFYKGPVEDARQFVKSVLDKGEMAGRKALELDPQNPVSYQGLTYIASLRGQWGIAEDYARKALTLDPDSPEALQAEGAASERTGYLRQSLLSMERARTLDPLVAGYSQGTANRRLENGQAESAIALLESMAPAGRRNMLLARAYASEGRYADAADTVLLTRTRDAEFRKFLEDTARLLRSAPKPAAMPQYSPAYVGEYNFVYAHTGAIERVMEYAEYQLAVGYNQDVGSILWLPNMAPLRKTERFKMHMRKIGLVDYWRERGWPDLCKPVGANDFACE
jgi:TolB-like protein/tetratricopeptide (TPR) repeat protein